MKNRSKVFPRFPVLIRVILPLLALALALGCSARANAEIASGTWGTCAWEISDAGVLTIHRGTGVSTGGISPWKAYADRIVRVVATEPIVLPANSSGLLALCENDESGATVSSCTAMNLSGFNTSAVTNMRCMFEHDISLTALDLSSFSTANVTDMGFMFNDCGSLQTLNISGFRTEKVTDMPWMFSGCSKLTALDVSGFDTARVRNMSLMFSNCYGLTALDVSGFDTARVTDMSWMFFNCSLLRHLDVSGFNTANVTNMSLMFYNCVAVAELDVSGFDTARVTNMDRMFSNCENVRSLNVSGFQTSLVMNMNSMFSKCRSLTSLNAANLDVSQGPEMEYLFADCAGLRSIVLPSSMKELPPYVLKGCTMLEQFEVPSAVERIQSRGLAGAFSKVIFTGNPPALSDTMFEDYMAVKIVYPADNPAWNSVPKGNYGAGTAVWLASGADTPPQTDPTVEKYNQLKAQGYDNVWNMLAIVYRNVDAPNCQDSFSDDEMGRIMSGLHNLPGTLTGLSNGNMQVGSFDILTVDTPITSVSNSDGSLRIGENGDVNFQYLLDHKDVQMVIVFAPVGKIAVGWAGLGGGWIYNDGQSIVYNVLLNGSFNWNDYWSRNGKSYCLNTLLLVHEICHGLETNSRGNGWNGFIPLHDNLQCGYGYNPGCDYIQWYADLMADTIVTGDHGFKKVSYLIRHKAVSADMANGVHLDSDGVVRVYSNGLPDTGVRIAQYQGNWVPVRNGELDFNEKTVKTPAGLREIEAEAFAASGAEWVVLNDQVASIGSRSFADCADLKGVVIPASVQFIAPGAFEHSPDAVLYTCANPYAEDWARTNGIPCVRCQ